MSDRSSDRSTPPQRKSSKHLPQPPTWRSTLIQVSALAALTVYLFVQAPAPLAATPEPPGTVPIRAVFSLLAAENGAARALWTEEIVNRGTAAGLAFDEHWQDEAVHAGPLPALFLRETARGLERSPLRLRLFLGSRYPINAANAFTGEQATHFGRLEAHGVPQFFYEPATRLQTAMFADRAVVEACVRCHNEHASSPKTDWKQHDIMGATTWMYPDDTVTVQRALELIAAYRTSVRAAYATFLREVGTWATPPAIGARWPRDGAFLPTEDAFMNELARRTSTVTLRGLLDPAWATQVAVAPAAPAPAPAGAAPAASVPAETRVADAASAKAPAAPRAAAPSPAFGTDAAAEDILVIRTTRSTRVTVEHAGSRLMVARLRAGATASLTSRPPLRVQLSDPDGVELEYRGQKVDLPAAPRTMTGDGELEITIGGPIAGKS